MDSELLELCGYEPGEVKTQLPRVQRALGKLGLGPKDVERGKENIRRHFDIELVGMRKTLGIFLREMVNTVLAREEGKKKVIYSSIPALAGDILSAVALHSAEVKVAFVDLLVGQLWLSSIFNRLDPVLEEAERHWLSASGAHCGLVKSRLGLLTSGMVPKPDLSLSLGNICDEAPKSDEIAAQVLGIPVQFMNLCNDQGSDLADIDRLRSFFVGQLERCRQRIEDTVGFKISDEVMDKTNKEKDDYKAVLRKVTELVVGSDPVPLNLTCHQWVRSAGEMPLDREGLDRASEAIRILLEEVKGRVARGEGVVKKGAPKVLLSLSPSSADPVAGSILEDMDVAVPLFETMLYLPDGRLRPPPFTASGPLEYMAHRRVTGHSQAHFLPRARSIAAACRRYNLSGMFLLGHYACRAIIGSMFTLKAAVEREIDIPIMAVEGDLFDARFYTASQLRNRLEAFPEMLRGRKLAV